MRNIWIITKREYQAYFSSPIAYVVAAFILVVVGLIFALTIFFMSQQPGSQPPGVDMIVGTMATVFVWTLPAITMRLISDETRSGTIELLLTAPVRDWEVVVGKWLAAFLFVVSIIALTFVYPVFMNQMTVPGIDQGLILSGYLAVVLLVGELTAIGVLISSLFKNQVASLVATLGVFVVMWFLFSPLADFFPSLAEVIRYVDVRTHFTSMLRGVIELQGIVLPVSLIALFLMLGAVSLESRRWR